MFKQTFGDYLIKTYGDQAIEKYIAKENTVDIFKIGYTSDVPVFFNCEQHDYHGTYRRAPHHWIHGQRCPYCSGRKTHPKDSIFQWFIDHGRQDMIDRWDYELNTEDPYTIRITSSKKVWLKCPRGLHESKQFMARLTITNKECPCDKCKSVKQYLLDTFGDNGVEQYWSDENTEDPYSISIETSKKYKMICQKNKLHPPYLARMVDFKRGVRCPYCYNRITIPEESFGVWATENIDPNFIQKYWSDKNEVSPYEISPRSSNKKIWIKCQVDSSHPDYETIPDRFYGGARCCYCSHSKIIPSTSFGGLHPTEAKLWSSKNTESPYDIPTGTTNKYWFHCDLHGDYYTYPRIVVDSYYKCPVCSRNNISQYEAKTLQYLDELGVKYLNEYDGNLVCVNPETGYRLPYDNELPDYKLIIEVNGSQHYSPRFYTSIKKNKEDGEEVFQDLQKRDAYKKQFALDNGYHYLAIPYWNYRTDYYKTVINNKLKEITDNSPTTTKRNDST